MRIIKSLFCVCAALLMGFALRAQAPAGGYPEGPGLEFVVRLNVDCTGTYTVGETAKGTRTVIPIVGGTFEGPKMKGEVLAGGADYQLNDPEHGRTEVEAIYSIKTDDGVYIHVRNSGLITMGQDASGAPSFYFRTAPKFEAPRDSKYAWLNDAIFVCMPGQGGKPGAICLDIWKVL